MGKTYTTVSKFAIKAFHAEQTTKRLMARVFDQSQLVGRSVEVKERRLKGVFGNQLLPRRGKVVREYEDYLLVAFPNYTEAFGRMAIACGDVTMTVCD